MPTPSDSSVQQAMEQAWKDHHHARDQSWKAIQIVFGLAVGLITIDFTHHSLFATSWAALLVIVAALFGASITWNHRILERKKFIHLMNFQGWLGLLDDKLIPVLPARDARAPVEVRDGAVKVPERFKLRDIFNPFEHSTALFILRMHIVIMFFSVLLVFARYKAGDHPL
jgi:hypothetical protein